MRTEWFDHFKAQFDGVEHELVYSEEGHSSHIFYAFDLEDREISSKAYFFPGPKARELGQSNLEVISRAIKAAPHVRAAETEALSLFCEYAQVKGLDTLELDMLALDMIDPLASRLKIYFRIRETTFTSVIDALTLGGRVTSREIDKGLDGVRELWNSVLDVNEESHDLGLPFVGHRTAGILYNVAFKLGDSMPEVKIYIPVRHYATSDREIMRGLSNYLYNSKRHAYLPHFEKAMTSLL